MPERVLITGGNGYIGSVLVPYLLWEGYSVRVLSTFTNPTPSLASCISYEGFEPVRGDCRDAVVLEAALKGVDWIIPLAAVVGAPACDNDQYKARTVNAGAIYTLLDLVRPEQRIVYPTTNSGYGTTPAGLICGENTPLKPISLYGITKQQAETDVLENENAVSFRLATVFGPSPRMRLDLLVNDFIYRAVRDKCVTLYEAYARRNYMHIWDVSRLFLFAMRKFEKLKEGRVYNAGLHFSLTKKELCEEIQKYVKDFQVLEAPTGKDPDKRDYAVSVEKLEEAGFKCCISLTAGIRELIKFYRMFPIERFRNA